MPSKNDLSALKGEDKEKKILPEPDQTPEVSDVPEVRPVTRQSRVGRPKKAPAEKRDYKIVLSLTKAEGAKIRANAGLAAEATYLYDILKKTGVFK